MRKIFKLVLLFIYVNANSQADSLGFLTPPDSTSFGTPQGKLTSNEIGPAGGTITSDDGRFKLIFPPGALTKSTTITIQPVTNPTVHGTGLAYDFEPSGIKFLKPVQLIFTYNDEESNNCPPELMSLASQDHTGKWTYIEYKDWDSTSKTLTGEINHFSSYTNVNKIKIRPKQNPVYVNTQTDIEVLDITSHQGFTEAGRELLDYALLYTGWETSWFVNGYIGAHPTDGSMLYVKSNLNKKQRTLEGAYIAPKSLPRKGNPVEIVLKIRYYSNKLKKKVDAPCRAWIYVIDQYEVTVTTHTYLPFNVKSKIADNATFTVSIYLNLVKIEDIKNSMPVSDRSAKDGMCELSLFADGQEGHINIESDYKEAKLDMDKSPPEVTITFYQRDLTLIKYQWKCRGAPPTAITPVPVKSYPYQIKFKLNGEQQVFNNTQGQDEFHILITPKNKSK